MPKHKEHRVALVILAAGSSSRMGECKQLLAWKETTLLEHCITQAKNTLASEVFIVLGAYKEEIQNRINLSEAQLIFNPNWEKGISASITFASQTLIEKNFDGLMFMLADQPQIDSPFLNLLIEKSKEFPENIIATAYPKSLGVPAIFPAKFYAQLMELKGEYGAKTVIKANQEYCLSINANDKIMDIDTQEEYKRSI